MLKIMRTTLIGLVGALALSAQAMAAVIVDLYGDKDGLGIGVADGDSFFFGDVTADDPADVGTITDRWMFGDQTWSHTYDLTGLGTVTGGSLEIFTGGQGWFGQSSLFLDGVFVGLLTDGDGFDGGDNANRARLDTFDLAAFLPQIDGANTLRVDTVRSGDGWALDYSELTITTAVPEPATLWLIGVGLLGIGLARARKT